MDAKKEPKTDGDRYAWVTMVVNDAQVSGVLVLVESLKKYSNLEPQPQMVVLINSVSIWLRELLIARGCRLIDIVPTDHPDSIGRIQQALRAHVKLSYVLGKLLCWTLDEYEKCVFLEADCIVVQCCDELFECKEISFVPTVYPLSSRDWASVFVYKPSKKTYFDLINIAIRNPDGIPGIPKFKDMGLAALVSPLFTDSFECVLSCYFGTMMHSRDNWLPLEYNRCSSFVDSDGATYHEIRHLAKIIRFADDVLKPWDSPGLVADGNKDLVLSNWWETLMGVLGQKFTGTSTCLVPVESIDDATVNGIDSSSTITINHDPMIPTISPSTLSGSIRLVDPPLVADPFDGLLEPTLPSPKDNKRRRESGIQ